MFPSILDHDEIEGVVDSWLHVAVVGKESGFWRAFHVMVRATELTRGDYRRVSAEVRVFEAAPDQEVRAYRILHDSEHIAGKRGQYPPTARPCKAKLRVKISDEPVPPERAPHRSWGFGTHRPRPCHGTLAQRTRSTVTP